MSMVEPTKAWYGLIWVLTQFGVRKNYRMINGLYIIIFLEYKMYMWAAMLLIHEIYHEIIKIGIPSVIIKNQELICNIPFNNIYNYIRYIKSVSNIKLNNLNELIKFTNSNNEIVSKCCQDITAVKIIIDSDQIVLFFPTFILNIHKDTKINITKDHRIQLLEEPIDRCPICLDSAELSIKLSCNHIFCYQCLFKWLNTQYKCPYCRESVT